MVRGPEDKLAKQTTMREVFPTKTGLLIVQGPAVDDKTVARLLVSDGRMPGHDSDSGRVDGRLGGPEDLHQAAIEEANPKLGLVFPTQPVATRWTDEIFLL